MATARTGSLCHRGDEVSTPHAADGQEEETAKEVRIMARERENERERQQLSMDQNYVLMP